MIGAKGHNVRSENENVIDPWAPHRRVWHELSTAKNFRGISFERVLFDALEKSEFVDSDYSVLGGTPRIRDTRIPVYTILEAIEHHGNLEGALKAYPQLTLAQVKDAVIYAASVLECSVDGD